MDDTGAQKYYELLKRQGRLSSCAAGVETERRCTRVHQVENPAAAGSTCYPVCPMQQDDAPAGPVLSSIRSLDDLLERDRRREQDGFPRKIKLGKLIKPGRGTDSRVVVVPTTVEEKFLHDNRLPQSTDSSSGGNAGHGSGEEGEVVGEQPLRPSGAGEGTGAGQGEGSAHDLEANAYDLGRVLTEQFKLPNLKEKGKKRSLSRYVYDLTDTNRGFGQVLEKKATLRRIIKTNSALGRIDPTQLHTLDSSRLLIAPRDRVYRVMSREKDYESQALVFFVRDYSASMHGGATELVVTQHVLIYSWLMYQYAGQVETRFILHDTEAREVDDFATYYNSTVAGGTRVAAGYQLINTLVEHEGLAADYNIYVFHGTDGDDWDKEGRETLPELKKMLKYASRVGITVAEHPYSSAGRTELERYLIKSGLLEQARDLLRLDSLPESSEEARVIEGIRQLVSEE